MHIELLDSYSHIMGDAQLITVSVLTVSDTCSAGDAEDRSGPALRKCIEEGVIPAAKVSQSFYLAGKLLIYS